MYLKSILLLFAILYAEGTTALPDVGKCTFMEYFCDATKCQTVFVKRLQKDPNGDCSAKFERLIACLTKTGDICAGHYLSQSRIESLARKHFKENVMCLKGGYEVPAIPSVGSPCRSSFSTGATNCLRTFHHKFAANKSDPDLCSENAKAKKCLKNQLRLQCTFSSSDRELIDLGFNDYNPFCKNNRDPEATGNDQCYGVKDLGNPLNNSAETAGMRPQALLVPFLLLFFFV
ncbi:hypothetical protein ABFA07_020117 [Porites harrisoni]